MVLFAKNSQGLLVEAKYASDDGGFLCFECSNAVILVRASKKSPAYFRHVVWNDSCQYSIPTQCIERQESFGPTRGSSTMTPWHAEWQHIGSAVDPKRRECRGIGDECQRPRDLVIDESMIEIQHSPMSSDEYRRRNAGVKSATWIFDATTDSLWKYCIPKGNVFFCSDRFRENYGTSDGCRVLFHCADGNLYQTVCDDTVHIEGDIEGERSFVRILEPIDADTRCILDLFFGKAWPLKNWNGMPELKTAMAIETPIRVLSGAGRREIDLYHRDLIHSYPTAPHTVISAAPGAGKTTAIIEMIRHWRKRVLVITFNRAASDTMRQRINEAGLSSMADARTIDSLCHTASGRPSLMKWSDWKLCSTFWPKSAKFKFRGRFGAGRRSSKIIEFRLRHPRASVRICKTHDKLGRKGSTWGAELSEYPIKNIVDQRMIHAANRYACDTQNLLCKQLDSYDAIIVDEMQDLLSAQEQRLIFQTRKPIVMIGDPMQSIYNFRDEPPCAYCHLPPEDTPVLPPAIEWYGTWRLDGLTARFIEHRFKRPMYSHRSSDENAEIFCKDELVYDNTFVMCRHNKHVIEVAIRYPLMRVVNGSSLAERLIGASKDLSMVSPMAKFAQELDSEGKLDTVCHLLEDRSINLADVQDVAAVATVHQAKGFEYDHCAVHHDLLSPETDDEQNISYVAFTRHKKSLVLMCNTLPGTL